MTTVFGFAALMISTFGIISNFGTVTVISVFFALASAIIVMLAILVLVSAFDEKEHIHNSPTNPSPVSES
jgi:predicted RND superfamily exporter protein